MSTNTAQDRPGLFPWKTVVGLLALVSVCVVIWFVIRRLQPALERPEVYRPVFETDHTRLTGVYGTPQLDDPDDFPAANAGGAVTAVVAVGQTFFTAGADHSLKRWDATSGKVVQTLRGHTEAVTCLALSADGKSLLSGSADKTVKLWDAATGKELKTFTGHTGTVTGVAFATEGRFVSAGADGSVRHWQTDADRPGEVIQSPYAVTGLALAADGRLVVTGNEGGRLELWQAGDKAEARVLKGHSREVTCVALSADGKFALSGSQDQTVKLWDVAGARELRTLRGHSNWITGVCFSPDGKWAASVSDDLTVRLWGLGEGQPDDRIELGQCSDCPRCVTFTPDGRALLVGTANAVVLRFELKN